jgi:hypothetical protein
MGRYAQKKLAHYLAMPREIFPAGINNQHCKLSR